MGLLLSRSSSHGENNSTQSAFYTNQNLNCQTVSVKHRLQTIVFTMWIKKWQQQSHCVLTLKTIVRSQSALYILYSPIVRKRIPFCILSCPSPSSHSTSPKMVGIQSLNFLLASIEKWTSKSLGFVGTFESMSRGFCQENIENPFSKSYHPQGWVRVWIKCQSSSEWL